MKKAFKFIFIVSLAFIFLGTGIFFLWAMELKIPDFESFSQRKMVESTKIYDRTGKIMLYDVHQEIRRTIVPWSEISRNLKNATVAIEDRNFYRHKGISPSSILRAFLINLKRGEVSQGASTITQQLVKNTFLVSERSYARKLKEIILALKIEKQYGKEEILNFYLNEVYYGEANYGAESASQTYFGKSAKDLTLSESAYLAALPKAPSYYSPYGSHQKELEERKNLVLKKMLELGYISEEEENKARREKTIFRNLAKENLKVPHFVMYARDYLISKYGQDLVEQGGLKVITTLDYELQKKAEEMVKKFVDKEEKEFNVFNAGLVGIAPATGQILVMVGSKDWWAESLPDKCEPGINCRFEPRLNVAVYGKGRQPGSALKPFVYATLFKKGYAPETVLFDLFTEFRPECSPEGKLKDEFKANKSTEEIKEFEEKECYHPSNYDNKFRGPVSIREALAQSINVPAVKALYLAGLKDSLETMNSMGIKTLNDPGRYGLTLVLGGGEVKLIELTQAYGALSNDGRLNLVAPVLRVENSKGEILEEYKERGEQVLEENIARTITDILSDNKARAPAFGESSYLYFPDYPSQVAVKTGTTDDYRDAWVAGYTKDFALGVWFGNNDNTAMEKKVAGFIAAPLWNAFFKEVFKKYPPKDFEKPEQTQISKPILAGKWQGGNVYLIDRISGKRATDFTPPEYIEEKVLLEVHDILYWLRKDDPLGPAPVNPVSDFQFNNWDFAVQKWKQERGIIDESSANLPQEFDDVHKPEYQPKILIANSLKDFYRPNDVLEINLSIANYFPVKQIDFFLGENFLGSLSQKPYEFKYNLNQIPDLSGEKELIIRVYDEKGNKGELVKVLTF